MVRVFAAAERALLGGWRLLGELRILFISRAWRTFAASGPDIGLVVSDTL